MGLWPSEQRHLGGVAPALATGGHLTVYAEVPDVGAALDRSERLGGRRMLGPDEVIGGLEIGQLADPEGHLIGLIRSKA